MVSFDSLVSNIKHIRDPDKLIKESLNILRVFLSDFRNPRAIDSVVDRLNKLKSNPQLANCLKYITIAHNSAGNEELIHCLLDRINLIQEFFEQSISKIIELGQNKIQNHMSIFTHSTSNVVSSILIQAHKQGKNFQVHNTESRPRFSGRRTAVELSKAGLQVIHYPDAGVKDCIKNSDMLLFGTDKIFQDSLICDVGSSFYAEIANKYCVPVYVCTHSWAHDTSIEHKNALSKKKLWKNAPDDIQTINFTNEILDLKYVTGIISELGIIPPDLFFGEFKSNYSYLA